MNQQELLIALGANLPSFVGNPSQTLHAALQEFSNEGLRLRRVSRFYDTPAFPEGAGPDYVNTCAMIATSRSPSEVLEALHRVEARFARKRLQRWGSRTLDLDLIAAGSVVFPNKESVEKWINLSDSSKAQLAPDGLILPHPRLAERAFVLVPLAEIAPDWTHPISGKTVRRMLADLPQGQRADIRLRPWSAKRRQDDTTA